jgi:hypothetical protein
VSALIAPFLVACAVLCVAGVAKLRSPAGAAHALAATGLSMPRGLIRAFAAVEVALAAWAALAPSRLAAAAIACLYVGFAGLGLLLARRRAACGCFGEGDAPASPIQALLSLSLAMIAVVAVVSPPHGVIWLVGQQVWLTALMLIAIGAAAYATVAAYTDLPVAWGAWSAR